jgi:adenylate cyclase
LAADVVGYTAIMGADEDGTFQRLANLRQDFLEPLIDKHRGRIFKLMGDGMLVEFASVVDAVACALAWQEQMGGYETASDPGTRFHFRIGINLGDVIVEGSDIHGEGVNIAARLEALAKPGGICLSADAYRHSKGKVEAEFEDMGEQVLKNVAEPVRAYRIVVDSSSASVPVGAGAMPLPEKPSVAVLPFTNMSGDPEQEYFSDGITEDIITELSRFRGLSVIARNSTFHYKGLSPKVEDLGRELGVQFVVEGSVRRMGNRVRITSQLIEVTNSNHVWAERYDRDLEDVFAVQDEVTRAIVSTVAGRIALVGHQSATRISPDGLKAYDLLLRAKSVFERFTRRGNAEARVLLERAIALDPTNAEAHATLCATHYIDWIGHWVEDADHSLEEAIRCGKEAVAVDNSDCRAHWNLGEAYIFARDFEKARFHFKKAIDLNPNDVEARTGYGLFLTTMHEIPNAIAEFEHARQVDPQDLTWLPWLEGYAHFTAKHYDRAIACFERIEDPHFEVYSLLAASYAHLGRLDDAKPMLEDFLRKAESEMVDFPGRSLAAWKHVWRSPAIYKEQADTDHWFDGLRKAGLS